MSYHAFIGGRYFPKDFNLVTAIMYSTKEIKVPRVSMLPLDKMHSQAHIDPGSIRKEFARDKTIHLAEEVVSTDLAGLLLRFGEDVTIKEVAIDLTHPKP